MSGTHHSSSHNAAATATRLRQPPGARASLSSKNLPLVDHYGGVGGKVSTVIQANAAMRKTPERKSDLELLVGSGA